MKRTSLHVLWVSLVGALVLCVGVFAWITVYMTRQGNTAIHEVGTVYMSQMGAQLKLQFGLLIETREAQLEELASRTMPHPTEAQEEVSAGGRRYGYSYLGLYDASGESTRLLGEKIDIVDETAFLESLRRGEEKVTAAVTASGEKLLLFGTRAAYPMADGGESMALVAGLPMTYLQQSMSLDIGETLIYSHFICKDGRFILRNADATEDSYFDRVRHHGQSQDMIQAMLDAVAKGDDYAAVMTFDGERRSTYLTPLPHSDWYLVSVMPYGVLEEPVVALSRQRIVTTLIGCGIIAVVLSALFFLYFRLSQQQMLALDDARKKADQANRAKSEFLSNMSHDIRTPMNAIVGMTAIASVNADNPERVRNCLQKIALSSKHLLGLINDVLDMSKIESGKLTLHMDRISLREVMESIVNIIQPQIKAKNQQFDVYIQDVDAEEVFCDGIRLNQVLLNLLSNAVKFTPDCGSIQLALRQEPSPAGDAFVRLHFIVRDTGIGMSQDFQQKLFEAFERGDDDRIHKIEGTGLGMAITQYIVEAMNGQIEVTSAPGAGSEFCVVVDLERVREQEQTFRLPAWDILLVDDDEQICRPAASALREMGAAADWTLDGESAIRMVQARQTGDHPYQIILLDWKMPGFDGLETARRLRQQVDGDIPILLISAYEWGMLEQEAKAAGVSGFVAKPLFKSTLYYALREYMGLAHNSLPMPADSKKALCGKHLLLAEDNDLNWEIACELLSELGLVVDRAENGRVCLEKFEQSAPGSYDGILMDIRMPEMNGYEATKAIRLTARPDAQIPIIAMTADALSEDIQRCLSCGMNDHITKPIDLPVVIQTLCKHLVNRGDQPPAG